jgi:hypothetical protein
MPALSKLPGSPSALEGPINSAAKQPKAVLD